MLRGAQPGLVVHRTDASEPQPPTFLGSCLPAALVLGPVLPAGPTPGLPRPHRAAERICGVVAFVVSLVAGSLLRWGSR